MYNYRSTLTWYTPFPQKLEDTCRFTVEVYILEDRFRFMKKYFKNFELGGIEKLYSEKH